ncbi:MAG TPA: hypothetical protein PK816_15520 [Candidatus Cloacimonadota bacterium]|nr:hypothetical protein [Candidatus Cloacimonadota bacterium]
MKIKYLSVLFFALMSMTSFGQKKEIRIGPGLPPSRPEPVIIIDGIRVPNVIVRDFLKPEDIDSISVQADSIFDSVGEFNNYGIIRIFTRDSVNPGAKKLLDLTDNWMYYHPQTALKLNRVQYEWNLETYKKLAATKPEDILSARVKRIKNDDGKAILMVKVRD